MTLGGRFFSTAFCGNRVDGPAQGTRGAWKVRPRSLLELLANPEAPDIPIEPFELDLLQGLLHAGPESWTPVKDWKWGQGEELVVSRYADTQLFGGSLFGRYKCILPKATMPTCAYCIINSDERLRWDGQGQNYETRSAGDAYGCETTYFVVNVGFPFAARDFLSYHSLYPHPTHPGGILLYMRHATDSLRPTVNGIVRGKMVCNAIEFLARKEGGVELNFISCLETGLPVSPWLINMFIPGKMRQWFGNLATRCETFGKEPPIRTDIPLKAEPLHVETEPEPEQEDGQEESQPSGRSPKAADVDMPGGDPMLEAKALSLVSPSSESTTASPHEPPEIPLQFSSRSRVGRDAHVQLESTAVRTDCWGCSRC